MEDIHNYAKRVETYLRKLRSGNLSERNKDFIEKFVNDCYSEGITHGRVYKYIYHMSKVAGLLNKDFDIADQDDLKSVLRSIELNACFKENTKRDFRVAIKKFYKWLNGGTVPSIISWIKTGRKHSKEILPEDILTQEEIRRLVNAADNPRDKAFIFLLYESGCRIGETLNIKLKQISFDEYGIQLVVSGKTGARRLRIILATDYIRYWIENHPGRQNPESFLWVSISTNCRGKKIGYQMLRQRLYGIAQAAHVTKDVNFHNFRHSRATHLATYLTEAQMCEYFGWRLGSQMPRIYVHMSGRNLDDSLLKMHGLKEKSDDQNIFCPRCKTANNPISRYCLKCGLPFGLDVALRSEASRKEDDDKMTKLLEDEEVRQSILKAAKRLGMVTDR